MNSLLRRIPRLGQKIRSSAETRRPLSQVRFIEEHVGKQFPSSCPLLERIENLEEELKLLIQMDSSDQITSKTVAQTDVYYAAETPRPITIVRRNVTTTLRPIDNVLSYEEKMVEALSRKAS